MYFFKFRLDKCKQHMPEADELKNFCQAVESSHKIGNVA